MNLRDAKYHYTGLLSLKEASADTLSKEDRWLIDHRKHKVFHIVDGQQRLTTVSILIFEILKLVRSLPKNKDLPETKVPFNNDEWWRYQEQYVRKITPDKIVTTYLFGYESDNPSAEYLKHEIFEATGGSELKKTLYTQNLLDAKTFFKRKLQELLYDKGLTEIEALFNKVTSKLMFNVYQIEKDYNEFMAFETMNSRGQKLTNLERFKNRLIYLVELFDDTPDKQASKYGLRTKINDTWKEIYYQLGRNPDLSSDSLDDAFLQTHWCICYERSRVRGDEYVKDLLDDPDAKFSTKRIPKNTLTLEDIDKYVLSLKEMAKHWYYSFAPLDLPDSPKDTSKLKDSSELTDKEKLWIDRLNRIGMDFFRPLVVASLVKKVDSAERVKLYEAIERFIFLGWRVGTGVSRQKILADSKVYGYAGALFHDKVTIEAIVEELNSVVAEKLSANHITDTFKRTLNGRKGFYSWWSVDYFLYEYEMHLEKEKTGERKVGWREARAKGRTKKSIEHIYPQKPNALYWQKRFGNFSEGEQERLKGSLGNLLLLEPSFNTAFSNHPYPQKRNGDGQINGRGYRNGSNSEIEIANEYVDDWTKESILGRGSKLLKWAAQRWKIQFTNGQIEEMTDTSDVEK